MNHESQSVGGSWLKPAGVLTGLMLMTSLALFSNKPAQAQAASILAPNATIHVNVADEPDDSGDLKLDSNGDIQMLYVNSVHVGGLTIDQARDTITKALSKYIKSPQVVVSLVSQGGIYVEVAGAVTTQGGRVVRVDSHLNDVLSPAEPSVNADLEAVQIEHGEQGQTHSISTVNFLSYLQNKVVTGNPLLQDGDKITVFQKQVAITITMRGAIVKPGPMSVSNTSTVLDSIQAAGGLAPDANRKGIVVQHTNDVTGTTFDYDAAGSTPGDVSVNPVLRDGDTVVINALAQAPMITISGGGVLRPAPYPLMPNETLCDAISIAGGAADGAKLDKCTIVRKDPAGKSQLIAVNAKDIGIQSSTMLQTGDNIIIPGSPPKQPGQGLGTLLTGASLINLLTHL
jgi:protein involved in polysaccharide export with SLBB domain